MELELSQQCQAIVGATGLVGALGGCLLGWLARGRGTKRLLARMDEVVESRFSRSSAEQEELLRGLTEEHLRELNHVVVSLAKQAMGSSPSRRVRLPPPPPPLEATRSNDVPTAQPAAAATDNAKTTVHDLRALRKIMERAVP